MHVTIFPAFYMSVSYDRLSIDDVDDEVIFFHTKSRTPQSKINLSESKTDGELSNHTNFDYNASEQELILTTDLSLGRSIATIRHDGSIPISRPPTKPRDSMFGITFLIHFIIVVLIFVIEDKALHYSFGAYTGNDHVGSWASLLMIITLIGSFIGALLSYFISNEDYREKLFHFGMISSIIFQTCLGNILLLIHSTYSIVGLFFLISAFVESYWWASAMKSMSFTSALVQMSIDICRLYGLALFLACSIVVVCQTCLLLWWGAFFVGILLQVTDGFSVTIYMILVMSFSYYWITQFFSGFMSYLIGGCILWYFLREEDQNLNPTKRILLLLQCGISTSFGSICKGAVFSPIAQLILALDSWSCRDDMQHSYICSCRHLVKCIIGPFVQPAIRYNRLAYCLIATYGRTFCKAAEDQVLYHPQTLKISTDDSSYHILTTVATSISGMLAIIFGLIADRNEGSSWPLFFMVNFLLAFSGVSLVVHAYRSAVDALIVAFAEKPERFSEENQLIFLRFARFSEESERL